MGAIFSKPTPPPAPPGPDPEMVKAQQEQKLGSKLERHKASAKYLLGNVPGVPAVAGRY